jgi:8-oxo-dGTP diphosphatase
MISVYIFNADGTKLLIGKKYDEGTWSTINGKLDYGETFEDCAARILCNIANILVEDPDRIKFVCTYNAVDKTSNVHIVSIDYYVQVSKEEEKFHIMLDPYYFQSWNWYSYEELLKMYDSLFIGLKTLLKKFNIKSLDDIKSLVSN